LRNPIHNRGNRRRERCGSRESELGCSTQTGTSALRLDDVVALVPDSHRFGESGAIRPAAAGTAARRRRSRVHDYEEGLRAILENRQRVFTGQ
jgi:hypothetical protein